MKLIKAYSNSKGVTLGKVQRIDSPTATNANEDKKVATIPLTKLFLEFQHDLKCKYCIDSSVGIIPEIKYSINEVLPISSSDYVIVVDALVTLQYPKTNGVGCPQNSCCGDSIVTDIFVVRFDYAVSSTTELKANDVKILDCDANIQVIPIVQNCKNVTDLVKVDTSLILYS